MLKAVMTFDRLWLQCSSVVRNATGVRISALFSQQIAKLHPPRAPTLPGLPYIGACLLCVCKVIRRDRETSRPARCMLTESSLEGC